MTAGISYQKDFVMQRMVLALEWKTENMNLAVFAQNSHSGEILQALKLALK